MKKKIKIGGVALFDGIVFLSEYRQVEVQRKNGKIFARVQGYIQDRTIIQKIPFIRGIIGLKNQIGDSANTFVKSMDEDESATKFGTILSYLLMIVICVVSSILISIPFKGAMRNVVQAIVMLVEFILYFLSMKLIPELNTLFMYHGAEHKAVNAYETMGIEGLTLENVKKQSRLNKRCGGNLIMYFMFLTLLSTLVPVQNLAIKACIMLLLGIFNIGLAYEIVTLFSILKKPFDIIAAPATLIQLFTTKEPTDDMIELAIYGALGVARKNNGVILNEYVNGYIKKNLRGKKYDRQDIYKILEYVTNIDPNRLILQKDKYLLTLQKEIKANELLDKYYNEDYPLEYITHKKYIYNEKYYVDENVLIPRSDSEILIQKAIEYINLENLKSMIDLCTGSGALGISVAKNSDIKKVELIDISPSAIRIAKTNIKRNIATNKVCATVSDLLKLKRKEIESLKRMDKPQDEIDAQIQDKKVDIIISNPPYIKSKDILSLDARVQKEPKLALDGGQDGMDFYKRIFKEAKEVLREDGLLMFEIGYDELNSIKWIIKNDENYELLESVKDYGGNDRVVVCRFHQM